MTEHDLVVLYGVRASETEDPGLARAPLALASRFPDVNLIVVYGPSVAALASATAAAQWLTAARVRLDLSAADRRGAIHLLIERGLTFDDLANPQVPIPLDALVGNARAIAPRVTVAHAWWNALRHPTMLVGVYREGLDGDPTPQAVIVLLAGYSHGPSWQLDKIAELTAKLATSTAVEQLFAASEPQAIVDLLGPRLPSRPTPSSRLVDLRPAGSSVGIAPGVSGGGDLVG
jgi:hypothetical protein